MGKSKNGETRENEKWVSKKDFEKAVRGRIAEIMSAAGVDRARVSQEILFKLPEQFVQAYELLFDRATGVDPVGGNSGQGGKATAEVGKATDVVMKPSIKPDYIEVDGENEEKRGKIGGKRVDVQVKSGGSARRASGVGNRGSTGRVLGIGGSQEALDLKARIDKRLRGMAREIEEMLKEMGEGVNGETREEMVGLKRRKWVINGEMVEGIGIYKRGDDVSDGHDEA